ncbi:MAG: hypothetical protein ABEJ58_00525 [Halodesulfurarchaeum sp.]
MNEKPHDVARNGDGEEHSEKKQSGRQFTFTLPPFHLPPFFPDHLRVHLPLPGFRVENRISSGWLLVACLVFDIADAYMALVVAGPVDLVRTLGGTLIALVVVDRLGVVYLWELVGIARVSSPVTVAPTLSVLVLYRMIRETRSSVEA